MGPISEVAELWTQDTLIRCYRRMKSNPHAQNCGTWHTASPHPSLAATLHPRGSGAFKSVSSGLQSKGAALSKHSKVRSVHTQSLVQQAACPTKLRESEGLLLPGGSTWLWATRGGRREGEGAEGRCALWSSGFSEDGQRLEERTMSNFPTARRPRWGWPCWLEQSNQIQWSDLVQVLRATLGVQVLKGVVVSSNHQQRAPSVHLCSLPGGVCQVRCDRKVPISCWTWEASVRERWVDVHISRMCNIQKPRIQERAVWW